MHLVLKKTIVHYIPQQQLIDQYSPPRQFNK
jgi:hypothetical protein